MEGGSSNQRFKHVEEMYQNREQFIQWLVDGDLGPENVHRYGIQLFGDNLCVTTRVEKYLNNERFWIHIIVQEEIEPSNKHDSVFERNWSDTDWILLMEGYVADVESLITDTFFEEWQTKMEEVLVNTRI